MSLRLSWLAFAIIPAASLAATSVHVTDVVDGDTIRIRVDGNVPGWDVFDVRLIGVNTPEKRSRCETNEERETEREMAARAENYVRDRIDAAESIEVDKRGEDSFNRALGVVLLDGQSLNDDLLSEGWALPYQAGTHGRQWCGDAQKGAYPAE